MISLVIPSHNNLKHLKNAYESILKHAPEIELVLIDDASTDGTYDWMKQKKQEGHIKLVISRSEDRKGHTILYDLGIESSTNEIVGIMHADMIMGPNYIQNLLKHIKPKIVVCGTRIEPPLHPQGREKITKDFGTDFDDLNIRAFEKYCYEQQNLDKDKTTRGMFAPWIIYKKDFLGIGGHDPLFAPFPYEDSDIFQRWILSGYELIQSRDAFVYHLTCRGHRWSETIGKDDEYYKEVSKKAARNYIRKWGCWIKNDEYQYPLMSPKYNIGIEIKGRMEVSDIYQIEPWCNSLYLQDCESKYAYILEEQKNTFYDLENKIKPITDEKNDDITLSFDKGFPKTQELWNLITNISDFIDEANEGEIYGDENVTVTVNRKIDRRNDLIFINKNP